MTEFGNIVMTLNHLNMVRTVVCADPVALMSTEFLDELYKVLIDGPANEFMNISMDRVVMGPFTDEDESPCPVWHLGRCYHGALIYITPENDRKYIYRVGPYNYYHKAWEARWVD